jgi:2-keto-4-pentenoate hydratase/2-oxohepta-3-ene-1,7-dioic acid hydratase in catechol pathway
MKLVTFEEAGRVRAGLLSPDADPAGGRGRLVDLSHSALRPLLAGAEPQLAALLPGGFAHLAAALDDLQLPPDRWLELSQVQLLAPFPSPPRILGAAHNYRDALAERGMALPEEPVIFEKDPDTVVGPGVPVAFAEAIGGVTWEAELAAVLGAPLSQAAPEKALQAVAGYFIFNDISASEVVRADGHFRRGKNFPTFGPSGPVFVTADEVTDPQALALRFTLNGEVMQDSSTSQMLFGVGELIARLSNIYDLQCGDVIATGTPAGVGAARQPPRWLADGDVMVCEVEGLGRLENPVRRETAHG